MSGVKKKGCCCGELEGPCLPWEEAILVCPPSGTVQYNFPLLEAGGIAVWCQESGILDFSLDVDEDASFINPSASMTVALPPDVDPPNTPAHYLPVGPLDDITDVAPNCGVTEIAAVRMLVQPTDFANVLWSFVDVACSTHPLFFGNWFVRLWTMQKDTSFDCPFVNLDSPCFLYQMPVTPCPASGVFTLSHVQSVNNPTTPGEYPYAPPSMTVNI